MQCKCKFTDYCSLKIIQHLIKVSRLFQSTLPLQWSAATVIPASGSILEEYDSIPHMKMPSVCFILPLKQLLFFQFSCNKKGDSPFKVYESWSNGLTSDLQIRDAMKRMEQYWCVFCWMWEKKPKYLKLKYLYCIFPINTACIWGWTNLLVTAVHLYNGPRET